MTDKVLGIDPHANHLAFGWIDETGAIDTFDLSYDGPPGARRLVYWREAIFDRPWLLDDVVVVVVEIPWARDKSSFILLSVAGVVIEVCQALTDAPVMEMPTSKWKGTSVGKGNATKDECMEYARTLGYDGDSQDAADALCMSAAGWSLYRKRTPAA
jgi:hypothetical protein